MGNNHPCLIIKVWSRSPCVYVSMNTLCDNSANGSTSPGWGKWERVEEGGWGCRICQGLGQRRGLRSSLGASPEGARQLTPGPACPRVMLGNWKRRGFHSSSPQSLSLAAGWPWFPPWLWVWVCPLPWPVAEGLESGLDHWKFPGSVLMKTVVPRA